jgi:hypothetical protein
LVLSKEARRRAVNAYYNLLKEEQNDIKYFKEKYIYKDANKFDYILGFAFKPFNRYILYSFTNGLKEILSIIALKGVFRKANIDYKIKEFFKDISKKPLKLLINGFKAKRKRK